MGSWNEYQTDAKNLIETVGKFVKDYEALSEKISKLNADSSWSEEYKRDRAEAMADTFREAHAGAVQAISDAEKRFQADIDGYNNELDLNSDYLATLSRTVGMFGAKAPSEVVAKLVSQATRPVEARMAAATFENAGIKSGPGAANARAGALTVAPVNSFASRAYIAMKDPTDPTRGSIEGEYMHWRDGVKDATELMQYGPNGNPNAE